MIYLDTHVAAWLYAGRTDLLPTLARSLIDGNELLISPMAGLELQYLYEIKKTTEPSAVVLDELRRSVGLAICDLPFEDVMRSSLGETWTRDPFDRIIVAQARLRSVPLVTKDRSLRSRYDQAVWDRPRGQIRA